MTPDRLKELRKIAEKANNAGAMSVDRMYFAQAANPQVLLSLLDLIDRQREALENLYAKANRVSNLGAVRGTQWVHLTGALLNAKCVLNSAAPEQHGKDRG